ncbi:MAG: radical SAM protein [Planctomycetota bacterium]
MAAAVVVWAVVWVVAGKARAEVEEVVVDRLMMESNQTNPRIAALEACPQHVFGPVPSRRLGRSLGIDLVPFKTCSYDCIYCQLGRTTNQTVARRAYVALDEVLAELESKLGTGPTPDYITLSGSGEPTLHSELARAIRDIKHLTDCPLAVLTNGSLLWNPDVREALAGADLVIPSLDAGDEETFQRVNRPHAAISFERMLAGLEEFRRGFAGLLWLEVLLLQPLTSTVDQIDKIAHQVERIKPDCVQLNTVTRPPSEASALALSPEELAKAAQAFGDRAEVIADCHAAPLNEFHQARREDVLNLLKRRPVTLNDVALGLGLHPNEVAKYLDELVRKQVLVCQRVGEKVYYRIVGARDRAVSAEDSD